MFDRQSKLKVGNVCAQNGLFLGRLWKNKYPNFAKNACNAARAMKDCTMGASTPNFQDAKKQSSLSFVILFPYCSDPLGSGRPAGPRSAGPSDRQPAGPENGFGPKGAHF